MRQVGFGAAFLAVAILVVALAASDAGREAVYLLSKPTNWQVGFAIVPHAPSDPYWWTLGVGALNSIVLAAICLVTSSAIGCAVAVLRLSANPLWAGYAAAYVQLFRNVPLILQALFWFALISHLPAPRRAIEIGGVAFLSNRGIFIPVPTGLGWLMLAAAFVAAIFCVLQWRRRSIALAAVGALGLAIIAGLAVERMSALVSMPVLRGFNFQGGLRIQSELLAIALGISLFAGAYIAEIVRGGFLTVPRGVLEAAQSFGLSPWAIFVKVRAPLALRSVILPLGSQYTTILKLTALGLAVGYADLFSVTLLAINHSGQTIPLILIMTACFAGLNLLIVAVMNLANRRLAIPGYQV
jgi:His/Glu/Gln/Arg/opine family amino acid ABC transporter permease subunit